MLNYNDITDQTSRRTTSLLLGNGFSISYDSSKFHYERLFDSADFGTRADLISKLFNLLGTFDFEHVARVVNDANRILPAILPAGIDYAKLPNLDAIASDIKNALKRVLISEHPIASVELDDVQANCCAKFLRHYRSVFTTNYDLLLYWVLVKGIENHGALRTQNGEYLFSDGFGWGDDSGSLTWPSVHVGTQSIFYLHGAVHLFGSKSVLHKLRFREGEHLMKQITDRLNNADELPVLVTEGTSDDKRRAIARHPYLSHCLFKLQSLDGDLVTFGTNLSNNDLHIAEAIARSGVRRIFVGVYGRDVPETTRSTVQFMKELRRSIIDNQKLHSRNSRSSVSDLDVEYYDTSTVSVWQP